VGGAPDSGLREEAPLDRQVFARAIWVALCCCLSAAPALAAGPAQAVEKVGVPGDWLSQAVRSVAAREYEVSANAQGLQAPNRRHNFRAYFDDRGLRLVDRVAAGSPELARVQLAAIGRGRQRVAVSAGALATAGARVEVVRPGGLREQFENTPEGLVQTVTIAERPPGQGGLVLSFRVGTALVESNSEGVLLRAPGGRLLAVRRLPVTDATSRPLPSRLEAAGDSRMRLLVEDAAAVYPLVLKLIVTGTAESAVQSNQSGAQFGLSVAAAGDVNGDGYGDLIVGANLYDDGELNEGAAFVFLGSASGIVASNAAGAQMIMTGNQADANFGVSVASAGDVNGDGYADVVVGASSFDSGELNEGAAFVYIGSSLGILLTLTNPQGAATTLQGNQAAAGFGIGVASAGDVNGDGYADVVVGAYNYDAGESEEGAAFVFAGSASGVASAGAGSAVTTLQGNQASARFGWSVASAGDVNGDGYADVVVGAYLFDSGESDEGAAFVFVGSAAGVASGNPASAAATLQANQGSAALGFSVASAGDVNGDGYADVLVGSPSYDLGEVNEGAAFVFPGGVAGVVSGNPTTAATTLQGNQSGGNFGTSVASAGDTNGDGYADVLVGAPLYDLGQVDEGAAFVFIGGAAGIANGAPFVTSAATLEPNQPGAEFGQSVAAAGDVNGDGYADVVVGAYRWESSAGENNEGAVFVYWGSAGAIAGNGPSGAAATLESNQTNAAGGNAAGAGDVNGDGYADILVGAPAYDSGENNEGAVFLFLGGASGIASGGPLTAATTLQGNQASAFFGSSVAGAGDVNGDGFADVIVGAYGWEAGQLDEGAAFVFLGSAAGIASGGPASAATVLQGNQGGAALGFDVAGAGDVNGDGFADVVVGAIYYDLAETDEGAAFVFLGSAGGIAEGGPATAATTLRGNQASAAFGYGVDGAGDVNGDGYADLLIGAIFYDAGQASEGAAFVYLGGSEGIASGSPASAASTLEGNQVDTRFGESVAGAGDVNGDGYADILVGAFLYDAGETDEGGAFLFLGSASGVASGGPATAAATVEGDQVSARLGSVAAAGDVNGDGFADALLGAPYYDFSAMPSNTGGAFLFLGSASGMASGNPLDADAILQGDQADAAFGSAVAGAGDINGDGYGDLLVGASLYAAGQSGEGAAFVFLGNRAGGRPVLARQFRAGSSTPVAAWGGSLGIGGFDARMFAYHPAGGGRVKFEVEACPAGFNFGTSFGTSGCVTAISPGWADVTATSGTTLSQTVSGLRAARLYHWRSRALYAPATVTKPGIIAPPKPAHGPWRRLSGQAVEADIRTLGGIFYTLVPCRVMDTRTGSGAPIGGPVLTSGLERTLPFFNKCGVPTTARAVSVNLTAVSPTGPGQFVLYPRSGAVTPTSNLSFNTGLNRANNSVLGLNGLGQMQVLATVNNPAGADEVHLLVDVNGYFE
jgi:FG-GAP repeat/FG-GAP-like repeat